MIFLSPSLLVLHSSRRRSQNPAIGEKGEQLYKNLTNTETYSKARGFERVLASWIMCLEGPYGSRSYLLITPNTILQFSH